MKPIMFNFFNLISYKLSVAVILGLYVIQICGSGLSRHGPDEDPPCFRAGSSGPIFVLFGLDTTRAKKIGPSRFDLILSITHGTQWL